MASKLDASTWSSFTKKQGLELDDDALLKAFAKFGKTDESKPEPRLDALKEVVEQINKQVIALAKRKKELGDKPFGLAKDKLHELLDLAEGEQKQARAAVAAAAAQSEEEADSPVLLGAKMIPLVRTLRKGEDRMQALITIANGEAAVLIMRNAISPSRRKLMTDYLGAQGGAKHFMGECAFEAGALTFYMPGSSAGMAKRVRAALFKQLDLRLKVRMYAEDGSADDDGEEGGEEQEGEEGGESGESGEKAQEVTSPQQGVQPPPGGPASAEGLAYTQRLAKLSDRLAQALRDVHPESTKLRAVSGFASEKAAAKDYAAATKALDMLEKLLAADDPLAAAALAYAQRLAPLKERVTQALRDIHPDAAKLRAVNLFASEKAAAKDYTAALKALDTLEKLLDGVAVGAPATTAATAATAETSAQTASQQRAAEAAATIAAQRTAGGVGVVEFAKMRLELTAGRADFDTAIDSLKTSFEMLLESEDFEDDPRSTDPETLMKIDTIGQRLPSFPALADSINDAIDEMASEADPARRLQHSESALKKIADFRSRIDAEPMLTEMQSTDAGSFPIHSAMVVALAKIAGALRAPQP